MSWTITLDREELDRVAAVLGPCPPVEAEGDGVWVRHQAGVRFWEVARGAVTWQVTTPTADLELAPRCLPGRLVWHAAEFTRIAPSETATISVPDDHAALVESEVGSVAIDLPSQRTRPTLPRFVTEVASATVTVRELYDLLARAHLHPIGLDGPRPLVVLAVDDGTLTAAVDWSGDGGLRSTFRIPARTTGRTRCRLFTLDLHDLLRNLDGDEDVTLGFPSDPGTPLLVTTHALRAAVTRQEASALRHHDELGQLLADVTGAPCEVLERGVFRIGYRDWWFIAELRDTPVETVCIASTLARNVEDGEHLWREINALNTRMVGARVWYHDGDVFGGSDLPYTAVRSLGTVLDGLCAQLDGFPEYLTAFSADPAAHDTDGFEEGDEFDEGDEG